MLVWDDRLLEAKAWDEARTAAVPARSLLRTVRGRGLRWTMRAVRGSTLGLRRWPAGDHAKTVVGALERLRSAGVGVAAVFSDRDLGLQQLERTFGPEYAARLESLGVALEIVVGPDHTFRPLWSHELLEQQLERLLASIGFLERRAVAHAVEAR